MNAIIGVFAVIGVLSTILFLFYFILAFRYERSERKRKKEEEQTARLEQFIADHRAKWINDAVKKGDDGGVY